MYHSITFGDKNTWEDWHLIPSSRPVFAPPPKKKSADHSETGAWSIFTTITFPLVCNEKYVSFIDGYTFSEYHDPQNTYNPYSNSTFVDAQFKAWNHSTPDKNTLYPPNISFSGVMTYSFDGIYGDEVISGEIYTVTFSPTAYMSCNTNSQASIYTSMTNSELRDFYVLYRSQIIGDGTFE